MMAVTTSDGKYHLIIGEQYTSDNYPYIVAERLINGKYRIFLVCDEDDQFSQQYKIISHMPVANNEPLSHIPLTVNLSYD
jgi:hypothetical protein